MTVHELKTEAPLLQLVWEGEKTAELRRDDRDYRVGDWLVLREWFTGEPQNKRWGPRFVVVQVTHVYSAADDALDLLAPGVVCLSFRVQEKGLGAPRTLPAGMGLAGG